MEALSGSVPLNSFCLENKTIEESCEDDVIASVVRSAFRKQGVAVSKSVSFVDGCQVVIVPSARQYKGAGCDLWYRRDDYNKFIVEEHRRMAEESMDLPENLNRKSKCVPCKIL